MVPTKFQQKSADHIFRKMFIDNETDRFLLADEPGLGKTIVACEVINKLHESKGKKATNVVYICSNMGIIDQNVRRLLPGGAQSKSDNIRNVRLTLWPIKLLGSEKAKDNLQIVSFTPGTSLYMTRSTGRYDERIYLMNVLGSLCGLNDTWAFREIFRGGVGSNKRGMKAKDDRWKELIAKNYELNVNDKSGKLLSRYRAFLKMHGSSLGVTEQEIRKLRDKINKNWDSQETHDDLHEFLGKGRTFLAKFALQYLAPDLIILDEFQNFREVLEDSGKPETIVGALFGKQKAKILMLSATPYRMYTTSELKPSDSHYEQFLETIKFLCNESEEITANIRDHLKKYRKILFSFDGKNSKDLKDIKRVLEEMLKRYMLRTERITFITEKDGGISEIVPNNKGEFDLNNDGVLDHTVSLLSSQSIGEVRRLFAASLKKHYSLGASLGYWKSGSMLPHFMGEDYELSRTLGDDKTIWLNEFEKTLVHSESLGNHQIEYLKYLLFDVGKLHQRLWIAPSLPYVKAPDPAQVQGKILVFSHWRFVPRYTSVLLSNCAANLIEASAIQSEKDEVGEHTLLQFKENSDSVFFVCYPSLFLASFLSQKDFISLKEQELSTLLRESIVEKLGKRYVPGGKTHVRYKEFLPKLLWLDTENIKPGKYTRFEDLDFWEDSDQESDSGFEYNQYYEVAKKITSALNTMSANVLTFSDAEVDLLVLIGMKSPAVSLARALLHEWKIKSKQWESVDSDVLKFCLMTLRRYFDRPITRKIIRRSAKDEGSYWEDVLTYCYKEDWQAMIDEYCYLLTREHRMELIEWPIDKTDEKTSLRNFFTEFRSSLGLRPGSVNIRTKKIGDPTKYLRHFALAYEDDQTTTGQNRRENIRAAFNSPFYPFILTTTTVGQEGIDFHRYCGDVLHWNLPSNPVDLEQREGRINRHSGLVVRRNIAIAHREEIIQTTLHGSLWVELFKIGLKKTNTLPLAPFWMYDVPDGRGWKLRRHVVMLPFSRDRKLYEALKRSLAFYRIAFGQPRQVDLVNQLMRNPTVKDGDTKSLYLDLCP